MKIRKLPHEMIVIENSGLEEKIRISQYDPKYTKENPKNYPEITISHNSGPCEGIGIRVNAKTFKKMAEWFLTKKL